MGTTVPLVIDVEANPDNFTEESYLAANPDVAKAVASGWITAREHFEKYGCTERRRLRNTAGLDDMRKQKISKLAPLLRLDLPHRRIGDKFDFLTDEIRAETGISDTEAISSNGYDSHVIETIQAIRGGLCIDIGAGRRDTYFENVVNYEIVDYDTTDVVGVGEHLPFRDGSFDAAFSIAVLEHVRDPFTCANEIVRVLKPGGRLICCVPLLQPVHGYPHHYYNMTAHGLRALFERELTIDDHLVVDSILPIWSLTWIVQSWAAGLEARIQEEFLELKLRDLMAPTDRFLQKPWVRKLATEKNFELASATMILAHKPSPIKAG